MKKAIEKIDAPIMEVADVYKKMYTTDKHNITMYTPRNSGKSVAMVQKVAYTCFKYPNKDLLVARANYSDLGDSLGNELMSLQADLGLHNFFREKKNPLRITTPLGNEIMFKGIGGADYSRTKGIKSQQKFQLAIIDEVQQLKDELSLKQALSTIRRNMDYKNGAQIIIAGNPVEVKGHWWNVYCRQMRNAPNQEFIDATYLDILKYIPDEVLEDINIEKEMNPAQYKYMYLGSLDELQGGAYAQFDRKRHYITERQAGEMFAGESIEYVIYGGDGAITHDATCICPIAIMSSGRAVALERFFYDPLATGQALAPVQLANLIIDYLNWMEKKYNFNAYYCDKIFAIDCASTDLITQLRYDLDDSFMVKSFTQKNVLRTNAVVNDAFAKNVLYIKDFGGQYLWHSGKTMQEDPLVVELESVVWKNYQLDPIVPNDCTDALTYGVNYYFLNPDNLAFPQRQKVYKVLTSN